MNLRKFIVIFIFILLFALKSISAQTSNLKFGVKGGLNMSTAIVHDGDNKFMQGYHIGGTVDYLFAPKFELQSGLLFSKTGSIIHNFGGYRNLSANANVPLKGGISDKITTFNSLYLKLPLYVAFRKNISDNFNFYTGFGLYFGYGIGGKSAHNIGYYDYDMELGRVYFNGLKWDTFKKSSQALSRFDFGAGINAGIESHNFFYSIGFERGLINIANKDSRPRTYKVNGISRRSLGMLYRNVNISISTGYRF